MTARPVPTEAEQAALDAIGFEPAPPRDPVLGYVPGPGDATVHAVGDQLLVDCYLCPERFPLPSGTVDDLIERLVKHGEQAHPDLHWEAPRWP